MIASISDLLTARPAPFEDEDEPRRLPIATVLIGIVIAVNLVSALATLAAQG